MEASTPKKAKTGTHYTTTESRTDIRPRTTRSLTLIKPVLPAPLPFPVCVGAGVPLPPVLSAIWTGKKLGLSVNDAVTTEDPFRNSSTQDAIGAPPLAVGVANAQSSRALPVTVPSTVVAERCTSVDPATSVPVDNIS